MARTGYIKLMTLVRIKWLLFINVCYSLTDRLLKWSKKDGFKI